MQVRFAEVLSDGVALTNAFPDGVWERGEVLYQHARYCVILDRELGFHAMKSLLWAALATAAFTLSALAENWTTTDGKTYKDVKVLKVDPDAVTIMDADGGGLVPLEKLSPVLQKRFNYDPTKAAIAARERKAQEQASESAMETERHQLEIKKQDEAAQQEQAAADATDAARYADLFQFPPKGEVGKIGELMRIDAQFSAQASDSVAIVNFSSKVIEPFTDSNGIVHDGGLLYQDRIAIIGLPTSFAEGSSWSGVVYPAGTYSIGADKFHLYATTREQAIQLLKQQDSQ